MRNYDGNRVVSWNDCVWQPKPLRDLMTLAKIEALRDLAQDVICNQPGQPLTAAQIIQLRHRGYNV